MALDSIFPDDPFNLFDNIRKTRKTRVKFSESPSSCFDGLEEDEKDNFLMKNNLNFVKQLTLKAPSNETKSINLTSKQETPIDVPVENIFKEVTSKISPINVDSHLEELSVENQPSEKIDLPSMMEIQATSRSDTNISPSLKYDYSASFENDTHLSEETIFFVVDKESPRIEEIVRKFEVFDQKSKTSTEEDDRKHVNIDEHFSHETVDYSNCHTACRRSSLDSITNINERPCVQRAATGDNNVKVDLYDIKMDENINLIDRNRIINEETDNEMSQTDQSINGDSVAKTTPRIERNPSAQLAAKLGREPFIPKSVLGLTDKINAGVSTNELDEWKILKEEKQKLQEEWIRLNNEKMRLKMKEEEDWNRMKERKERLKLKYPQNLSRHGQSRSPPPASPKPPLKLKTAAEVRNLSYDLWSRRSSHTFFESQKQIRERLRQLEKERRKQEEEKLKMSQEVYRCWISRKKEEAIAQKKRIKIEEEKLKEAQINERKHKEEAEKAFLAWKKEKETKKRSSKYPGFLRQKMHDHEIEKMKTAREAYELWQRQKKEMDKQNEIYGRRKKRLEEEQERIKQFKRKDLAKTSYEEWEIRKNSTMEDVKSIQDIPTFQRRPPWRPSSGQISARP